jgi:putative acetyltransferase
VFVAIDHKGKPVGFIELEKSGHIDCFYCRPKSAGTGVGMALYQKAETAAMSNNMDLLFVEASEVARRFFAKVGFATEKRRVFERSGVEIHNYSMKKMLKT